MEEEADYMATENVTDAKTRAEAHADLLRLATSQPGVAEVMALYDTWRSSEAISEALQAAGSPAATISSSTTSTPTRI